MEIDPFCSHRLSANRRNAICGTSLLASRLFPRVCRLVCTCVCLCIFAFVCIVFVSRGKHSQETPAVVMPAVTLSYSVLRL